MSISENTISEFRQLLLEEYGRDVSLEKAREILSEVVGYFDLLAKINFRINQEPENRDPPNNQ